MHEKTDQEEKEFFSHECECACIKCILLTSQWRFQLSLHAALFESPFPCTWRSSLADCNQLLP